MKLKIFVFTIFIMLTVFSKPIINSYYCFTYGTYLKPTDALEQLSVSLNMISVQLNKGRSTIQYLDTVEKTTHIIFKKI